MNTILSIFYAEFKKTKNTAIPWVIVLAPIAYAFLIYMLFLKGGNHIIKEESEVWTLFNFRYWTPLLMMFVPIFSAIVVSVSHYLDSKNNMWKVIYTFPISPLLFYVIKSLFSLILLFLIYITVALMVVPVVILLNFTTDLPDFQLIASNFYELVIPTFGKAFVATLAIWSIHNWISYRFDNFIVAISIALVGTIVSMVALQGWKDIVYFPYAFPFLSLNKPEYASVLLWRSALFATLIFIFSAVDAMLLNKTKA